jgi:hypothetical protein
MKTQTDYEMTATIAVFEPFDQADIAFRQLEAAGIPGGAMRRVALAPGNYDCADLSLGEQTNGVVLGAELGIPPGAALGIALAASIGGVGWGMVAGLAGAGSALGALVGSLVGAAFRARYDDDIAPSIHVSDAGSAVVLVVWTHSQTQTGRARFALRRLGAVAFLDPELYLRDRQLDAPVDSL